MERMEGNWAAVLNSGSPNGGSNCKNGMGEEEGGVTLTSSHGLSKISHLYYCVPTPMGRSVRYR